MLSFHPLYIVMSPPEFLLKDTTPRAEKRVIYFDGHTDTVNPLPQQWKDRLGEGVDAFDGLIDADKVNEAAIQKHLGYIPPKEVLPHS